MKKEAQLQSEAVRWFRMQYPKYRMLLYAIPNGGSRNVVEAVNLKRQGVLAGVADLFLSIPRHDYHGMYLELKAGKNDLTQSQQDFKAEATKHGYRHETIRTIDEFMDEVTSYLNPRSKLFP